MPKVDCRDLKQILSWYVTEKRKVTSEPYTRLSNWKDHNDLVEDFMRSAVERHVILVLGEMLEEERAE